MRIAVCTAVWKRHEITRVFWQWYAHLERWWAAHELIPVVAVSEDPEHEMIAPRNAVLCEIENQPLGRKFNTTLAAARALDVDAVLIMGSDDVFCERTAAALIEGFPERRYVGLKDLYFYETPTGRFGYWQGYTQAGRVGEPAGCGRLIGREILDERCDWLLWNPKRHHGMDHSSFKALRNADVGMPTLIGVKSIRGCAVDLKSPTNLWDYKIVGATDCPDRTALYRLPADLVRSIEALTLAEVAA